MPCPGIKWDTAGRCGGTEVRLLIRGRGKGVAAAACAAATAKGGGAHAKRSCAEMDGRRSEGGGGLCPPARTWRASPARRRRVAHLNLEGGREARVSGGQAPHHAHGASAPAASCAGVPTGQTPSRGRSVLQRERGAARSDQQKGAKGSEEAGGREVLSLPDPNLVGEGTQARPHTRTGPCRLRQGVTPWEGAQYKVLGAGPPRRDACDHNQTG